MRSPWPHDYRCRGPSLAIVGIIDRSSLAVKIGSMGIVGRRRFRKAASHKVLYSQFLRQLAATTLPPGRPPPLPLTKVPAVSFQDDRWDERGDGNGGFRWRGLYIAKPLSGTYAPPSRYFVVNWPSGRTIRAASRASSFAKTALSPVFVPVDVCQQQVPSSHTSTTSKQIAGLELLPSACPSVNAPTVSRLSTCQSRAVDPKITSTWTYEGVLESLLATDCKSNVTLRDKLRGRSVGSILKMRMRIRGIFRGFFGWTLWMDSLDGLRRVQARVSTSVDWLLSRTFTLRGFMTMILREF